MMADQEEDLCYEGTPIAAYRVVDLRNILDKHGLSKSGAKKELAARLSSYVMSLDLPKHGGGDAGNVAESSSAVDEAKKSEAGNDESISTPEGRRRSRRGLEPADDSGTDSPMRRSSRRRTTETAEDEESRGDSQPAETPSSDGGQRVVPKLSLRGRLAAASPAALRDDEDVSSGDDEDDQSSDASPSKKKHKHKKKKADDLDKHKDDRKGRKEKRREEKEQRKRGRLSSGHSGSERDDSLSRSMDEGDAEMKEVAEPLVVKKSVPLLGEEGGKEEQKEKQPPVEVRGSPRQKVSEAKEAAIEVKEKLIHGALVEKSGRDPPKDEIAMKTYEGKIEDKKKSAGKVVFGEDKEGSEGKKKPQVAAGVAEKKSDTPSTPLKDDKKSPVAAEVAEKKPDTPSTPQKEGKKKPPVAAEVAEKKPDTSSTPHKEDKKIPPVAVEVAEKKPDTPLTPQEKGKKGAAAVTVEAYAGVKPKTPAPEKDLFGKEDTSKAPKEEVSDSQPGVKPGVVEEKHEEGYLERRYKTKEGASLVVKIPEKRPEETRKIRLKRSSEARSNNEKRPDVDEKSNSERKDEMAASEKKEVKADSEKKEEMAESEKKDEKLKSPVKKGSDQLPPRPERRKIEIRRSSPTRASGERRRMSPMRKDPKEEDGSKKADLQEPKQSRSGERRRISPPRKDPKEENTARKTDVQDQKESRKSEGRRHISPPRKSPKEEVKTKEAGSQEPKENREKEGRRHISPPRKTPKEEDKMKEPGSQEPKENRQKEGRRRISPPRKEVSSTEKGRNASGSRDTSENRPKEGRRPTSPPRKDEKSPEKRRSGSASRETTDPRPRVQRRRISPPRFDNEKKADTGRKSDENEGNKTKQEVPKPTVAPRAPKEERTLVKIEPEKPRQTRRLVLKRRAPEQDKKEESEETEGGEEGLKKRRGWGSTILAAKKPLLEFDIATLETLAAPAIEETEDAELRSVSPAEKPTAAVRKRKLSQRRVEEKPEGHESAEEEEAGEGDGVKEEEEEEEDVKPVRKVLKKLDASGEEGDVEEEAQEADENRPPAKLRMRISYGSDLGVGRRVVMKEERSQGGLLDSSGGMVPRGTRPLSPARHPASRVVHIWNLVRPYTVQQLKDLLSRTGALEPGMFWMDRIKSQCIACFETEEQAVETRVALHGVKWPVTNPKSLRVDFGTEEELKEHLEKDLQISAVAAGRAAAAAAAPDGERRSRSPRHGEKDFGNWERKRSPLRVDSRTGVRRSDSVDGDRRRRSDDVAMRRGSRSPVRNRDWDRDKTGLGRSPDRDGKRRDRGRDEENVERKKKITFDDLFRKTKTAPYLYWLPLTEEQVAEKEEERRQRVLERQRRIAEIEKERGKRIRSRSRSLSRDKVRGRVRRYP